ncbi:MAG: Na/Pi cotransporter family protein, partial [Bacteroidota bacterium]
MNWWLLTILLLGGLALFLHGMTVMTDGLKASAGNQMKSFLKTMTRNRWSSLVAGTGITAVIQSSSVTTVLAVGFVSAGLLSFQNTLGIILGANLGTTITAQIIAFKITKASWIMVALGYLLFAVFKKKAIKNTGTIILGLGLVFLGMNVMSEATGPLKSYEPFVNLMKGLDNYLWGIVIGTVFTAAVQSSSATTGVVIVLASQGLISVEAGIAIIFGANIGTCVTAVLSAIGKPHEAKRVAVSHVLFNVAGVIIWYFFIDEIAQSVRILSEGEARQIANAHTLFNAANTIIFIWLVKPVAKLVLLLVPSKEKDQKELFPELHSFYLENPSMAIDLANNAIVKLGKYTLSILEKGINIALVGNEEQLAKLRKKDAKIDRGHTEILLYLQQIQSNIITESESARLEEQIEAVNILEVVADIITTDLV